MAFGPEPAPYKSYQVRCSRPPAAGAQAGLTLPAAQGLWDEEPNENQVKFDHL